jgi:DNA uptake protein ComE-like DNA-binding protein
MHKGDAARWRGAIVDSLALRPQDQAAVALLCVILVAWACASVRLSASSPDVSRSPQFLLDLNTASEAELMLLPGVGPSLARAIAQERAKAPFESPVDLRRTRGVGERTLQRVLPHLHVNASPHAEGGETPYQE